MSQRPIVIIGNWKMHKTIDEARQFVRELLQEFNPQDKVIGLAVPYTLIYPISQEVKETALLIGAQNMNDASPGAFTGEVAGTMLKDAGAKFVILGHSERRMLYGEDNAFINRKLKKALEIDLQPILCIGETKEEFEENKTQEVLENQLKEGLQGIEKEKLTQLILAYEPVWAIGTGSFATPEKAQEILGFCRNLLKEILSEEISQKIVIQYGGSVNASNAQQFLSCPDIDGLLLGGASLSLESFQQIVNDSQR